MFPVMSLRFYHETEANRFSKPDKNYGKKSDRNGKEKCGKLLEYLNNLGHRK